MCRRALSVVVFIFLAAMAGAKDVPQTSSSSRHISDIRTVCLINTNADLNVFDKLRGEVQDWGHWKIVEQPDRADVLLVLSQDSEVSSSMPHPRQIFELYAPYYWSTGDKLDTLTLTAVDRATDRQLLRVSCALHHFPPASEWLMSRLRKKVAKLEKSGK